MARRCDITGKRPLTGNRVSHANNKTKHRQLPNLQTKKIYVPELGRSVKLKVSTRALRTIDKKGLMAFLKKYLDKIVRLHQFSFQELKLFLVLIYRREDCHKTVEYLCLLEIKILM